MNKTNGIIKNIVLIGMLSATLTAGKFALSMIPNVEIVTLLIIVYTVVFKPKITLPVTIIFVTTEILIYGVNTWIISYYIHWCLLSVATATVFMIFGNKSFLPYTVLAFVMTALFGVLTTLVDTIIYTSDVVPFWTYFSALYIKGIVFFAIHIVSNTLVVGFLFVPLTKAIGKMYNKYSCN